MKHRIKAVIVDMDGTFLDDDKQYNRERFAALYQRMQREKVKFVVASGNQYLKLITYFPEIANEITFIAENGALVVEAGQVLFEKTLSPDLVTQILTLLDRHFPHYYLTLSGQKGAYVRRDMPEKYIEKIHRFYKQIHLIDDYYAVDDAIFKFALNFPAEELASCVQFLQDHYGDTLKAITSGYEALDIIDLSMGKESGVRFLQHHWQIEADEMAAFGDNMNDFELLQSVTYGYAMANGRDELKAIACATIGHNNDEAVLDHIEWLLDQSTESTPSS